MLPGFSILAPAGGFAFKSMASTDGQTGTQNLSVPVPPGLSVGDLLVVYYGCNGSNAISSVTPAGLNQAASVALASGRFAVYYLVITSVPGSISINTTSTSGSKGAIALAYSSADVDAFSVAGNQSSGSASYTTPGITTTKNGLFLAGFFSDTNGDTVATPPSGMTLRQSNTQPNMSVYDGLQGIGTPISRTIVWTSAAPDKSGEGMQIYGV
jgi:hypothetical protein